MTTIQNRHNSYALIEALKQRAPKAYRYTVLYRSLRAAQYAESFPRDYPSQVVADATDLLTACDARTFEQLTNRDRFLAAASRMDEHVNAGRVGF